MTTKTETFTCCECHRDDVAREDAFPTTRGGKPARICRGCREIARMEIADIARRQAEKVRVVDAPPPPDPAEERARRWEAAEHDVRRHVGDRYVGCTRENLEGPADALRILWAAADDRRSVLIFGPHGTGKTHAATVLYREALADGRRAVFRIATELVGDLKRAIERNEVDALVAELRKLDLLVIDDLAMERPTEWVLEQLCRVIDWRYRDGAQTVITTNESPKGLEVRYGDRVRSRIIGLVGRRLVHLAGRDHREDELRGDA